MGYCKKLKQESELNAHIFQILVDEERNENMKIIVRFGTVYIKINKKCIYTPKRYIF